MQLKDEGMYLYPFFTEIIIDIDVYMILPASIDFATMYTV